MLPLFVRRYLLTTLEGNPEVAIGLLSSLTEDDRRWDVRPFPERFTLREIVAHLADWETVFEERIRLPLEQDRPSLPDVSVDVREKEQRYTETNPLEALTRYRVHRGQLVEIVKTMNQDQWSRVAHFKRESANIDEWVTIEAWLVQMVMHDGYHLRQLAEWLHDS